MSPILVAGLTIATRFIFAGCCARAAIGHVAAVPPKSVMNSRRCMHPPEGKTHRRLKPNTLRRGGGEKGQPIDPRRCDPMSERVIRDIPQYPRKSVLGAIADVGLGCLRRMRHRVAGAGDLALSSIWRATNGCRKISERDRSHVRDQDAALFVRLRASRHLAHPRRAGADT